MHPQTNLTMDIPLYTEDMRKGIVKFRVDMYDETGESVAVATILTMVKFRDQG